MADKVDAYNETTDLYQQMLWTAKKVEDQKLVELIMKRLINGAESFFVTDAGCKVIPFPNPYVQFNRVSFDSEARVWPRQPLLQTLSLVGCYGLAIVASIVFGLS
jgi:hypothetical protein